MFFESAYLCTFQIKGFRTLRNKARNAPGIGKRLVALRAQMGLTQAQMAETVGVALRTYVASEAEERAMDAGEMAVLAGMGVNLTWLLTGHGSMMIGEPSTTSAESDPAPAAATEVASDIDDELMARVVDTIARAYKEAGVALAPMDLGRLAGMHYRRVSRTNGPGSPLNWDETLAMLRFLRISIMDELQKGGAANDSKAQGSVS